MKIKRVKDRVLGANQKHVMLSGVEGKTLMITRVEFYNLVRANELKKASIIETTWGLLYLKNLLKMLSCLWASMLSAEPLRLYI